LRALNPSQIIKYPNQALSKLDNKIITQSKLIITDLKNELSKILKDDLYIIDNAVTNKKQEFRIQTNHNEVVLSSSMTPEYYKIRECLYSIYSDQMDFNKN
jgi:hypothetical protein